MKIPIPVYGVNLLTREDRKASLVDEFKSQYSAKSGNNLYDTPTLGVIEYSNSKFNNYWTMLLPHSPETLNVINYNLALSTDSLVLFIAGDGTKSLRLSGLTLNELKINNRKLMYSAVNFHKEDAKDDEFGLILNTPKDD